MHTHAHLLLHLGAATATLATHVTLDRQCWIEHTIISSDYYTSKNGQEYISPIPAYLQKQVEDYTPWSHAPICTPKLPSINDVLCIYTSTSFSNGRGISIFTTPPASKDFAALPAFQNPSLLEARAINVPTNTSRATSIPNKGIGLLATKPLSFKDRITSHTPVFLAYLEGELSTLDRENWWRRAIHQLPVKSREEFLALAYVFGDERVRVQDIVKANTFQVEVGGVNHLAIFPETSRLNHACNANAQYIIDTELLSHTVHATRPIEEGEEITISYTSPLDPIAIRQQKLQSGFHFTCTCPRCSSASSDNTLMIMKTLQDQLNDWSPESEGSPKVAEKLLQLYRDEGLEGFMDVAYGFTALAYSAAGDAAGALKYAEMAKEAVLMKDGLWSANLQIWEEMLADLKGHWSWQRRL
ncbi:hypothetical protein HBH98_175790 [Parastagonospora nodorum]|nr:hypothetical protein HBH49_170740 [Parastagonospora nodorum]KAH4108143.1 hypothetical protein HBH46_044470 [Parastagonospora nodorum]KAH4243388.1 hypothetical protein HBI05_083030 [Parastagonospora nodorum]KAH4244418.1 hypothetical protein HBI06_008030 [Parastagonospora nodorum]KAH4341747.1 hypothetical protein HBH98_175790 [Parastagonospora nodorum]